MEVNRGRHSVFVFFYLFFFNFNLFDGVLFNACWHEVLFEFVQLSNGDCSAANRSIKSAARDEEESFPGMHMKMV